MKPTTVSTIRYFVRPYPWLFSGILLATLVTSFLEGVNVAAFFPVFQSLLKGGERITQGGILTAITAVTEFFPFQDPIVSAVVFLTGITLIKSCSMLVREGLVAYTSGTVQHDVKTRLMESYAHSPYQFFLDNRQGKLIYDTSVGASRVGVLIHKVSQLFAELLKVVAIGVLLLVTLPLGTLALAVIALGYHWLTHYLSKKVSYHTGKGRVIAGAEQTTIANEFLSGIRQIIAFGTHQVWLQRFSQQSRLFRNLYIRDAVWLAIPKGVLELAAVFFISGFILISRLNSPGALMENLPVVGVFAMALLKLLPCLTLAGQVRMEVQGLMGDAEGIYHVLTETKRRSTGGSRIFASLRKAIVFERVSFAHSNREVLLRQLNVAFEKGKVTALVGPSGSGKTTIVNLMLGLFKPTEGRILIDDVDVNEYRLETWLKRIGFVSQEPFIYHASVADNIIFGRDGYSRQSVQRAAEIANAHEFIAELPQAYETVVGERGMKLSGGEQQRIAIARAVLSDPEILIFDEATSSLDTMSERLVHEAIEKISKDRTVIIIAHQLSAIRYADKIVVLDQGRVIEEGSHEGLVGERGHYFRLVTSLSEREVMGFEHRDT